MSSIVNEKKCIRCGIIKSIDEFPIAHKIRKNIIYPIDNEGAPHLNVCMICNSKQKKRADLKRKNRKKFKESSNIISKFLVGGKR